MTEYRGLKYEIKDDIFVHIYNTKARRYHDGNTYGRYSLVRSLPEGCKLSMHQFAKTVIDVLWQRRTDNEKQEKKLFFVSKSVRRQKNVLNN